MQLVEAEAPGAVPVTVWSLEQTDPDQVLPPTRTLGAEPLLLQAGRPAPSLSRYCYQEVGGPWHWVDRLTWSDRQWLDWVARPGHELWTCWSDGVLAGYFELDAVAGDVELAYFGLVTGFAGQGLGGWLLTRALRRAWQLPQARRVWVHTCSLDGAAALPNYEARGLRRYQESVEWRRPDA